MDFEARLDKIGERVDALAQSTELLAAIHRDNELRLAKFVEKFVDETDRRHQQSEKRMAQHDKLLTEMMEAIARLAHVADIHEQRLEDLENRG